MTETPPKLNWQHTIGVGWADLDFELFSEPATTAFLQLVVKQSNHFTVQLLTHNKTDRASIASSRTCSFLIQYTTPSLEYYRSFDSVKYVYNQTWHVFKSNDIAKITHNNTDRASIASSSRCIKLYEVQWKLYLLSIPKKFERTSWIEVASVLIVTVKLSITWDFECFSENFVARFFVARWFR